jgi:hypothetical protein
MSLRCKRLIFAAGEHQDVAEHDAGKSTPSVATPIVIMPTDGIFGTNIPRGAIGHDVGTTTPSVVAAETPYLAQVKLDQPWTLSSKPTPSVATKIVVTPTTYAIYGAGEPRDDKGHDVEKITLSVPTPISDATKDAKFSTGEPPYT